MKYTGWVPSVIGRLSFTSYKSKLTGRSANNRVDWVFELEVRDLLDTIALLPPASSAGRFFREHIAQSIFGISGRFMFAYISVFDEKNDRLTGQVHVISEALQKDAVRQLKTVTSSDIESYSAGLAFLTERSPETIGTNGYWAASVDIYRSGQVNIDTKANSQLPAARHDDKVIAEQIYYFIKDLFHNHQHHDPKSDSLISVCEVTSFDDNSWIGSVHHALFRSVIRYKRFQTENHISKSLGILAYTEAFEKTFSNKAELKGFQTEQLKDSLKVAQDDARNTRGTRAAFAESVKTTFFAFFAFLVSMSFLLRFRSTDDTPLDVDEVILNISKFMMENFLPSLSIVGIFAIAVAFWTHSIDPSQISFVRGITRVFQGLRLRYFVIVNLIVTLVLVSSGWYLIFG